MASAPESLDPLFVNAVERIAGDVAKAMEGLGAIADVTRQLDRALTVTHQTFLQFVESLPSRSGWEAMLPPVSEVRTADLCSQVAALFEGLDPGRLHQELAQFLGRTEGIEAAIQQREYVEGGIRQALQNLDVFATSLAAESSRLAEFKALSAAAALSSDAWTEFSRNAEAVRENHAAAADPEVAERLARDAVKVLASAKTDEALWIARISLAVGLLEICIAHGSTAAHKLWLLIAVLLFSQPSAPPPSPPKNLPALVVAPGAVAIPGNWQIEGLPAIIRRAGPKAAERTMEFFFAQIRNPNTRQAYAHAVMQFFAWCEDRNLELADITPFAVAAYVEESQRTYAAPTVKQHLAAIRMLFDWLVVGQVIPMNPAASVRGPKHVVKRGKTPMLTADQARALLDSIETDTVAGLRDRALIGVMVYTFARVGAAVGMRVEDYYPTGKRWWFRLHEKGSKRHDVPAHHNAESYMDAYLEAAGIGSDKRGPLFRTLGRDRQLTAAAMHRTDILRMIKRRATAAGLPASTCCHTFRATGITAYLENGGTVEKAQQIAAHESPRTTKLYDRTSDELTLDEIERIVI